MSTGARLVLFVAGVAALFMAGLGAGALTADDPAGRGTPEAETAKEDNVSGLYSSAAGYSFVPEATASQPGQPADLRFRITGPDGQPVRDYRLQHERDLHLILASRDLDWFSHVHPVLDGDGVWSVPVRLPAPGLYRAFADFAVAGDGPALTLGVDLTAAGNYRPRPLPPPSTVSTVDGYQVTLAGAPDRPGEAELRLDVSLDGRPVTDLEPYLGAYGHLVALRAGDLAYLHVHPEGTPDDGVTAPGPEVVFYAQVPSAGRYHLYLDFKHEGEVRTAAFTVTGTGTTASEVTEPSESEEPHSGDGH